MKERRSYRKRAFSATPGVGGTARRRKKRALTARAGGRRPRILVAGLGNVLLRDDGVGVHAVKMYDPAGRGFVRAIDVGCAVFDALPDFEWADSILLIDAMKAGGAPGSVYRVDLEGIDDGGVPASLHDLSAVHALNLVRRRLMPDVTVLGIEPETIDYGLELSPAVEASLPVVLGEVKKIIREWTGHARGLPCPDRFYGGHNAI